MYFVAELQRRLERVQTFGKLYSHAAGIGEERDCQAQGLDLTIGYFKFNAALGQAAAKIFQVGDLETDVVDCCAEGWSAG
jgi:hypothetical protein